MRLPNSTHKNFPRRVKQILTSGDIGLSFTDNVGPVATFRGKPNGVPYDVLIPGVRESPASIFVLTARNVTTPENGIESNVHMRWAWIDGKVRVLSLSLTYSTQEYDITLGVWR